MDWYLLRTKPREEWRAKQHLENQQFTTYLPLLTHNDGCQETLFPGYIFLANQANSFSMHTVRSTRGVMSFVKFGTKIALAEENLIEDIRDIEKMFQSVPKFVPGQRVECISGPFTGLEAILDTVDGLDRCVILLKILNAERSIAIDQADLRAV